MIRELVKEEISTMEKGKGMKTNNLKLRLMKITSTGYSQRAGEEQKSFKKLQVL